MKGDKYRVFLSYSRDDREKVDILANILKEEGLKPMYDKDFSGGFGFHNLIENFIAYSHVFMPFITKSSSQRPWVHQEIGYAKALNVPILPITLDEVPGEMIGNLQALSWENDEYKMKKKLSWDIFHKIVESSEEDLNPIYECAQTPDERTIMLVKRGKEIKNLGHYGHIRQIGALSSFHIPDKPITHPSWKKRSPGLMFSEFSLKKLLEERNIFQEHAMKEGCSLIIDPYLDFWSGETQKSNDAQKSRIEELIEFLEQIDDEMIRVTTNKGMEKGRNLTILGDYFAAESISGTLMGHKQTILTRHAPTVQRKIDIFEDEMKYLLKKQDIPGESSKETVMTELDKIMASLE